MQDHKALASRLPVTPVPPVVMVVVAMIVRTMTVPAIGHPAAIIGPADPARFLQAIWRGRLRPIPIKAANRSLSRGYGAERERSRNKCKLELVHLSLPFGPGREINLWS